MQLRIEQPGFDDRLIAVNPAITTRIGSHASAEVRLAGGGVQGIHCGIVRQEGKYRIAASKAVGKIEVNGAAVPNAVLKAGDQIKIGDATLTIVAPPAKQKPAAAPRPVADELEVLDDPLAGPTGGTDELEVLGDAGLGGFGAQGGDLGNLLESEAGPLASSDPLAGGFGATNLQNTLAFGDTFGQQGMAGMGFPGAGAMPGMGAAMPGAAVAGGPMPGSAMPATAAAPKPRGKMSLVFTVVGMLLFLVPVIGLVVLLVATRQRPDELFAAAEHDYQLHLYSEAEGRFNEFVNVHPGDLRADDARVLRGLSRLEPQVTGGNDWPAALTTAEQVTAVWGPLARQPQAQTALGDLLPKIAAALVDRAKSAVGQNDTARAEAALKQAQAAMALVKKYLPPGIQADRGVDAIELQLTNLDRGLKQSQALSEALAAIAKATEGDQPGEVFTLRESLLTEYPQLGNNAALLEALTKGAAAQATRVKFATADQAAMREPAARPLRLAALLAVRSGPDAPASRETAGILDAVHGAAYGLDGGSGHALWRAAVGFGTDFTPLPLSGGAAPGMLLVDATAGELVRVDAATGNTIWRQAVGPADARPVIAGEKALVAQLDGALLEIDLASGAVTGRYELPQPLPVGPAVDAAGDRCFQLADAANLYVISRGRQACVGAVFVGHGIGDAVLPPVVMGQSVVVITRDGPRDTRLTVLSAADQPELLHTLELPGLVVAPPAVWGEWLFVAADDGTLHSLQFALDNPQRAPRRGPTIAVPHAPGDGSPLLVAVSGSRLWVGGAGLTAYALPPPTGGFAPVRTWFGGEAIRQLSALPGDRMLAVRSPAGGSRLTATSLNADDPTPVWETTIAAAPASNGLITGNGTIDWLATSGGWGSLTSAQRMAPGPIVQMMVRLAPVGGNGDRASLVEVSGERLAALVGGTELWKRGGTDADPATTPVPLPGRIAARPMMMGGKLLVPLQGGAICLFDPQSGAAGPPFLPSFDPARPPTWRNPVVTSEGQAVIATSAGQVYRLTVGGDGGLSLTASAIADVGAAIVAAPALAGSAVWVATDRGDATLLTLPSLEAAGSVSLGQRPMWGPATVGERVLVATADGRLLCLADGLQPTWEAALAASPIAGIGALDDARLVVAARDGTLTCLAADSGQPIGEPLRTAEELVGDPFVVGDQLFVFTADGSLLVSGTAVPGLFNSAASAARGATQPVR